MPLSKPFAVATAGPTIDGRNISPEWIKQMAASYDPKVYTAVVNLEHFLSSVPESTFSAYGKVVALGTQEAEIMGEKKLQLTAVVDASQEAIDMQAKGKKGFPSIEVDTNFIGKGGAYLTGLALTDTPASVGTESMKFSAFTSGKKDNVFAFASELEIDFEQGTTTAEPGLGAKLLAAVKEKLSRKDAKDQQEFAAFSQAVEAVAGAQAELMDKVAGIAASLEKFGKDVTVTVAMAKASDAAINEFRQLLDKTDESGTKRPTATGGNGAIETDC